MREQYSYSEAAILEHIFIVPAPGAAAPIQKARQKRKDRGASSRFRIILYQRQANSASAKFESISVICRRHNGYIPVPYRSTISERHFRQNAGAVYFTVRQLFRTLFQRIRYCGSGCFAKDIPDRAGNISPYQFYTKADSAGARVAELW